VIVEPSRNKVTLTAIEARIKDKKFLIIPDTTVTICSLLIENGYTVRGESACVDKRNFNMAIGEKLAYEDAIRKLWPLEGYLLANKIWEDKVFV
jgi:hypothetical protein